MLFIEPAKKHQSQSQSLSRSRLSVTSQQKSPTRGKNMLRSWLRSSQLSSFKTNGKLCGQQGQNSLMNKVKKKSELNAEIAAISAMHSALAGLETEAQKRVVNYVSKMLGIDASVSDMSGRDASHDSAINAEHEKETS